MSTVDMTCPNEECEAPYSVDVVQVSPAERQTRDNPGCPAEFDVIGPDVCACGEPLDTPSEFRYALTQDAAARIDAAMEWRLERVR